jgi:hypothetical protein
LAGTCSNSGTIRKMSTMGSHKVERIWRNSRTTSYNINKWTKIEIH